MSNNNLNKFINNLGFEKATEVQVKSYQLFSNNTSAMLISPTGSGKTHAYLIPLVERIDISLNEIQALIVVPTNELVMQVDYMLKEMNTNIYYKTLSAKEDRLRVIQSFKSAQPQIVIATPGRLHDLVIKENVVKVQNLKYLILDEADMLFDFDFMNQLNPVVNIVKATTYIYSATMPNNMLKWVRSYFGDMQITDLSKGSKLNIDHYLIKIGMDKNYQLFQLLNNINPYLCLIFVSKNENIEPLYNLLKEKDINVTYLSSALPIRQRKTIIEEVRSLKYQYLIASDIMARGIDFIGVSHIINYDMPYKIEFYVHRSGRTGRMGAHGEVYTFYEERERRRLDSLAKQNIEFKEIRLREDKIFVKEQKTKKLTDEEVLAIKKIKKPTKVKPGYKKKNKKKIKEALREIKFKKGVKK